MSLVPPAFHGRVRRALLGALSSAPWLAQALPERQVPVLTWHRFASVRSDSMTVRTAVFRAQLQRIADLGCTVVPLDRVIAWHGGAMPDLPPRAIAITADDGHCSQFQQFVPALRERDWHATLFIYPSAISNAAYAMTWQQLRVLVAAGGVSVQSHTWWHPNLRRDRDTMSATAFDTHAHAQLLRARLMIEESVGHPVHCLAWPFGIADPEFWPIARSSGHDAAFALGNRPVRQADSCWALPRYLIVDATSPERLASMLLAAFEAS